MTYRFRLLLASCFHFNFLKTFMLLLISSVTIGSCAKETSKEERKREETDRQYTRMQKAEGHYNGFISIDANQIVPLSLDLTANRSPKDGNDNPSLSASVQIGLFGGVMLSTSDVSFDWGNGRVTISFAKQKSSGAGFNLAGDSSAPGGASAPLEIRGTIDDSSVTGGVISGPISGTHSLSLSRTGPNLFTSQDHFNYQVQISRTPLTGALNPNADLNLKRLSTQHPSLKISDMPSLAAFDASVRFASLGIVPQVATDVIYDPILGFMEFQFGPNSLMRLEGLYLTKDALSMSLESWKPKSTFSGSIVQGATVYGHVLVGSNFPGMGLADSQTMGDLPPFYYSGTYKGASPDALTFQAIAHLEYSNTRGTNSAEFPFLYFPKFKLTIFRCDGAISLGEDNYEIDAMDQILHVARFRIDNQNVKKTLDISFTPDWTSVSGKVTYENTNGPIDVKNPQLNLQAKNLTEFTCAANHIN